MNQSRCDQNNNEAGSPLHIAVHSRGHAGCARIRPADRSFMSSAAAPAHLPKVGARRTCVLRMQFGHGPGPGASQGLFSPPVPRDAGMRGEGGDPARSGSSRTMPGTAAPAPAAEGARGSCAARLGREHPLHGETSHPGAFAPHGFPFSQREAGMRRIPLELEPARGR